MSIRATTKARRKASQPAHSARNLAPRRQLEAPRLMKESTAPDRPGSDHLELGFGYRFDHIPTPKAALQRKTEPDKREEATQHQKSAGRKPKSELKTCKEWRYRKIKTKNIVKQQAYIAFPNIAEIRPIPGKTVETPVYKYVWTIHESKSWRCREFNPRAKKIDELIGFYYSDSATGKLVAWGKSKPWEVAYTKEWRRLRGETEPAKK